MSEPPLFFAHPELGNTIWLWVITMVVLVVLERRRAGVLERLVSGVLQDRLVVRPSRWRRWARLGLLGFSALSMIVALMQPQWGLRYVSTPRVGAEIMIALDVSRSMLADDAKPSRLERAKAEISDLLSYLDQDYVGLIAFAGKASVLSPMTPDKSFLRLALDRAGPHSVTRGGTRLAEPILRAVAGMAEAGPSQRALILITDGEDHDSFALDAAKIAAEAGIKIITIGFGDEAGSQIYLRDPKTGVRSLLRDGEGRAVVSRLDGDLLREIALVTDGAFVPAGTGVLDLASIYDAHIAGLTRGQLDDRGRTIRDEAYQFCVFFSLIALLAAVWISSSSAPVVSPKNKREAKGAESVAIAFLLGLSVISFSPHLAEAQSSAPSPFSSEKEEAENLARESADTGGVAAASESSVASAGKPRERFNRANELLQNGDPIAAAALLRDARRDAAGDTSLRYAATYNLGMAAVARADSLRAGDASSSLDALYEAADWFREATAARPDESDPRHNLEVTLRRALILADEIAKENQGDIDVELDGLIDSQRERVMVAAALLEKIVRAGELDAAEMYRSTFRDSATEQRVVLSTTNALAERVDREKTQLASVPEADRSAEELLRAGQLEGVLTYLDRAIGRMEQTRRQLRQRRAERSYRRGSSALGELKRARDQLRDPVEQIGILLGEVGRLAGATDALARAEGVEGGELPAFLTQESVEEESAGTHARIEELATRFSMAAEKVGQMGASANGLGASSLTSDPSGMSPSAPGGSLAEQAQRMALMEASPLVASASKSMEDATEALGGGEFLLAKKSEGRAGEALAKAQELFFNLGQLLNATFEYEKQIYQSANSSESAGSKVELGRGALLGIATKMQSLNLARALRLESLLDREEQTRLAELEGKQVPKAPGGGGESASPVEMERQRFEIARSRLALASGAMLETMDVFGLGEAGDEVDWDSAGEAARRAADHLDAIRTLFFSIAEHVRRLALDQIDVRDQTQDALAFSISEASLQGDEDDNKPSRENLGAAADPSGISPAESTGEKPESLKRRSDLVEEEAGLESRAQEIADALLAQSEEVVEAPEEQEGLDPQAAGEQIRMAAEWVASAGNSMRGAGEMMRDGSPMLASALDSQTLAIGDLEKALELLSPPPPPPEESEKPDEGDAESSQEGEPEEQEPDAGQGQAQTPASPEEAESSEEMGDPSQLLQGVRDRDAERRRSREHDERQRRMEPVEKDW